MKILIGLVVVALLGYGAYAMWGSSGDSSSSSNNSKILTSPAAQSKNSSLDRYEVIIKSYEDRGGLKSQSDMLQFSSEIQSWSATWVGDTTGVSAEEASYLQNRLQSLTARQMKLLGR